jgi:DNA-binding beta-propeller fold protein YncE
MRCDTIGLSLAACALTVSLCVPMTSKAQDAPKFFQFQAELALKSSDSTTDHVDYDPIRKLVFMSRRKDGVTVVDVTAQKVIAQISKSEGSNAVALVPKHDRGYTGNGDGTTTIFKLSDFSLIDRVTFASNSDGGIYDAATDTVAFQQADDGIIALMDAGTGKKIGEVKLEGEELERPASDGKGAIFVPIRDKDLVFKVDIKAQKIAARWDISATCQQPSGADFDPSTNRLFLGCRGKMVTPTLVVLDADTGKPVATLPLGRGCDEVVFDPGTKQIFAANGVDGNVVVYKQTDADHYAIQEAFATRPGARVLRYDADTQHIYIMSNAGTFDPSKKNLARFSPWYVNTIFPNSLVLLTYGRGAPAAK